MMIRKSWSFYDEDAATMRYGGVTKPFREKRADIAIANKVNPAMDGCIYSTRFEPVRIIKNWGKLTNYDSDNADTNGMPWELGME